MTTEPRTNTFTDEAFCDVQYALIEAQQLLKALHKLLDDDYMEEAADSLLRVAYIVSDKLTEAEKMLDAASGELPEPPLRRAAA